MQTTQGMGTAVRPIGPNGEGPRPLRPFASSRKTPPPPHFPPTKNVLTVRELCAIVLGSLSRQVSRARCARAGIVGGSHEQPAPFLGGGRDGRDAPLAETTTDDYAFRYSTLDRVGKLAVRPTSEVNDLSFTLSAETFDKAIKLGVAGGPAGETVTEWRPVAFVPPTVTVTAISVAIPGTDAPAFITVTPDGGASTPFKLAKGTETVSLVGADGIAHTATLRTYTSETGVTLTPRQACRFVFDDSQVGTAVRNFYTINGAPHLRVTGSATITRHVLNISDGREHSFATLADFDESMDQADQVFVVEFSGSGGTLQMNAPLQNAPLVIGSSVSSTKAAVSFDSDFAVPLSLRDGEGDEGGLSLTFGTNAFNPSALLLACDVTLKSPVNLPEESWLATHAVPIPAGRTFRIELEEKVGSEDNLPTLSFADATSRLELASDAASPEENPLGIPSKYRTMLCTQSGTLVLDRNVSADGFTISDLRAYNGPSANRPLETHVILRDGHTYNFGSMLGFMSLGTPIGTATLTVEGGTVEVSTLNLTATDATLDIQGGTVKAGGLAGIDSGTHTAITVAKGATLSLAREFAAGAAGSTATLNLTVAGTLSLLGDVHMTPALRRTLRLEGGTIHATSKAAITCTDGDTPTAEDYLTVSGGGTLSGQLTVDSVTGNGTLKIGQGATVTTLYAYNGTIEGTIEGTGMIGAFTGDLGDVTLGGDWLTGEGKTLSDVVAKAQNYHGTLGFTAGTAVKPKVIDFASVKALTELPGAFRVANYQHVTMRLDQYIDATVRWPSPATGVTLTLIESGAYGGEAEIPAVPAGVTFAFQYYDAEGALQKRPPTDYQREPSEDGVSDELTWEDAVFTGQGAWIDVEFDGTSANTGWFSLGEKNGCLVGLPNANGDTLPDYGEVTTIPSRFTEMGHPVSEGMTLGYRPYVAESALPSFPEEWSLAVRMTAPKKSNKCILAIGNNFANATDSTYSLVFATGAVEKDGTTEIVLWKFNGYADGANNQDLPEEAIRALFRVKVADAQSAPHVFSVVCDGATLNLYMDGAWLNAIDVPAQTTLSGGLQLGQQLGGLHVSDSARNLADDVDVADGGAVDYIRFYKGAFPDAAMVEMADRTPYVRENLRYVRYVPLMTMPDPELGDYEKPTEAPAVETWIQKNAWLEQQWDGTKWTDKRLVDQPAEGAECRILVDAGEHAIQVNVERQVTGETDGDGQAVPAEHYFYSPNRTYASLVVRGQDNNGNAGILRLVPVGVDRGAVPEGTVIRGEVTQALDDQVPQSAWYRTEATSTAANRTGFRYGTLRFTGGANDPINGEDEAFYGAAYLRHATSGVGVRGVFDAGVCYLSKYAQVVLRANADGNQIQSSLEMVAGLSLTRGVMDEVARWQLTGPVALRGTATLEDHVLGHSGLPEDQASEDVWVPFFGADSTWKFYDDTRVEGGTKNGNGAKTGLFARGVQTPGRLYLDFTAENGQAQYQSGHSFSQQAWYRYNYEGETAAGPSDMTAVKAQGTDFDHAVAFQIRLDRKVGDIVTLTLDKVPNANVQTFYVEEAEGTTGDPLTLVLETPNGGKPLTVWQRVIAAARLDVSNDRKSNALNLRPLDGRHTPIHRGNSDRGAYIVGTSRVDWDFGAESSVPRLEVVPGAELTFAVGQNFRRYGTTLVAQGKDERTFPDEGSDEGPTMEDMMGGAWIHHTSNAPFLGQDIELGEGAYLGFHAEAEAQASAEREEGVVLAGKLRLTGNATLRADYEHGAAVGENPRIPRFIAAGGIHATEPGITLIVDAPTHQVTGGATQAADTGKKFVDWNCLTTNLTGTKLHLWKTGPGTVTFFSTEPPSVSGKVTVEEGTLNVTADAATPVGSAGLHVEADATLGDSGRMVGEGRLLAAIPAGQTLSGGGTVAGALGLAPDATSVATQDEHLTVTGGGDGGTADINVTLPTGYASAEADTPYLVSWREERTVRRRLRPTLNDARWDAIAWLEGGRTYYAARKPALPVPGDLDEGHDEATNVWHTGFEDIMVKQYQSLGHAYVGATQGRTRAGTRHLSASEINDALYAFSGISAFQPSVSAFQPSDGAETGRTYIDAHNFFVAYEFGVSRMAFATINGAEHVVVEVKVRNALADTFDESFAEGGAAEPAAFRTKTTITFQAVKDGKAEPLPETVSVEEVANLDGEEGVSAFGNTRYFALPYDALKDHFGDAPILLRPRATNPVELGAQ